MTCVICGIEIDSIEDAMDQGWIPYFYENEIERGPACSECSEALLQMDEDGEMELKERYRGKVQYKENFMYETYEANLLMGISIQNTMQSILN
ncbi:MAG TPA: hypothetical protein HPP58_00440 [Deltaproteobacteria bacterium]|nr:hypothetical protein [Deltaproteobacteria bacterium]